MKQLGHKVVLVSGRPQKKVLEAIRKTKASDLAIAENGGLIIKKAKVVGILGDHKICNDAYCKLKNKLTSVKKARGQTSNTEVILEMNGRIDTIRKHIGKYGLRVEINASKRFYHLHKAGVDKGAALTKFINETRNIDYDSTVAIGDSEIDLPMIEVAKFGFALGNAPKEVKDRVNPKNRLANSNFTGVLEAFCKLDVRFKKFAKKELDFDIDLN